MEKIELKTNISNEDDVAKVTSGLDKAFGKGKWSVDLKSANKVLHIEACEIDETEVISVITQEGYKAEPVGL